MKPKRLEGHRICLECHQRQRKVDLSEHAGSSEWKRKMFLFLSLLSSDYSLNCLHVSCGHSQVRWRTGLTLHKADCFSKHLLGVLFLSKSPPTRQRQWSGSRSWPSLSILWLQTCIPLPEATLMIPPVKGCRRG